jgi:hypothetical protein
MNSVGFVPIAVVPHQSEPMSIEECGKVGRKTGACPYYASKAAIADAEVCPAPNAF